MEPIRILIGMFGVDQHEVGALAVSAALRDAGLEVIYVGRYQTPEMIYHAALAEDVDLIGISCHSWEYTRFAPELMALLEEKGLTTPVVLGGSVITATDAENLKELGVAGVFGPSTPTQTIAQDLAAVVAARRQDTETNQ